MAIMDTRVADEERRNFSDRLKGALEACHQSTKPSMVAREFNLRADGAMVTVHGARKWLLGEAIPTQDKVHTLARWLNISAAWLRFGDADNSRYQLEMPDVQGLNSEQLMLIRDVMSLPPAAQRIVRDMVDSFLRHDGLRTPLRVDKSGN